MKVTAGEIAPRSMERWSLKGPLGQAMVSNCSGMWLVLKDFGARSHSTWIRAATGKRRVCYQRRERIGGRQTNGSGRWQVKGDSSGQESRRLF